MSQAHANESTHYHLVPGVASVEAWASRATSNEPKGWLANYQNELRECLARLNAPPGHLLHAAYSSSVIDPWRSDAENILFFNIRQKSVEAATVHGLRFERSYADAPSPPRDPDTLLHHLRYRLEPAGSSFWHWQLGEPIATWKDVLIPEGDLHTAGVWHRFKTASHVEVLDRLPEGSFGLLISVAAKKQHALTGLLKGLFDGVISAFSGHDGSELSTVADRLAEKAQIAPEQAASLLQDERLNALGTSNLIRPYQSSIQWHPRDHDCVLGELVRGQGGPDSGALISGRLIRVHSRTWQP